MFRTLLCASIVVLGILPIGDVVAGEVITTRPEKLYLGPASTYKIIKTIARGGNLSVSGCLRDFLWCKVIWQGKNGWVSGRTLRDVRDAYSKHALPFYGEDLGYPIITLKPKRMLDGGGKVRDRSKGEGESFDSRNKGRQEEIRQRLQRSQREEVRERRQLQKRQRAETLQRREDSRRRQKAREALRNQFEEELHRQR